MAPFSSSNAWLLVLIIARSQVGQRIVVSPCLSNRMLKNPASFVLASFRSLMYPRGYVSGLSLAAASLDSLFEHPVKSSTSYSYAQQGRKCRQADPQRARTLSCRTLGSVIPNAMRQGQLALLIHPIIELIVHRRPITSSAGHTDLFVQQMSAQDWIPWTASALLVVDAIRGTPLVD